MIFRSLRWRIATFYAILLLGVIAVVGVVLALELRAILFDEARSKVDSVASDIGSLFASGGGALGALGDGPQETALALTSIGALEHFAGPTTYVEIDNLAGYPENKSANFGGLSLGPPPFSGTLQPRYRLETLPRIGTLLVRSDPQPAAGVVVQVGESLELYDEALGRVRGLIVLVVALAAVVVV
ncbi:MAG: hypothetical protein ACREM2_11120, partial [Vulcanimicrobiaceae bacterium]